MKLLWTLLLSCASLWANFGDQIAVRLDAGATRVWVTDSVSGTAVPIDFSVTGSQRVLLVLAHVNVPPSGSETFTDCADPCGTGGTVSLMTMNMARSVINRWYKRSSGGSSWSASGQVVGPLQIPQIPVACASSWTFPIEVMGPNTYTTCVQVTTPPGSATTNIRIYARVNNPAYNKPGFGKPSSSTAQDGKMSVKVNGGAWIDLNCSTVTEIDENRYYSDSHSCAVGTGLGTIEITAPIPDGLLVANAVNNITWRFNGTDGNTSGYRVLNFNFQDTSTIKTLDQIAVTSNVATARSTASHGYSSNNWVDVINAPGMYDRFSGARQITVTDSTHFTFTPCGGSNNVILAGACTSPNGTYVVPTSLAPSITQLTQPSITVIRNIIPESNYSWDDPTTWTAGSGNATQGALDWADRTLLVNPEDGWDSYTLRTSCADCHSKSGLDLKYHNYSNYSITVRSIFHGLSETKAANIVAFIRGISDTPAATARPWNPPYQPAPGLDSGSVHDWGAGGGINAVLTYDKDWLEYAAPSGSYSSWAAATASFNTHEVPQQYQWLPWNNWLPPRHPSDFFQHQSDFFSSTVYGDYTTVQAGITANNFSSYSAASYGAPFTSVVHLNDYKIGVVPAGMALSLPGLTNPSDLRIGYWGIGAWYLTKWWELMHEKQLEQFEGQATLAEFGACSSCPGGTYIQRGWHQTAAGFNLAFHKAMAGTTITAMGGGNGSLTGLNAIYGYQSNAAYMLQASLNSGNRHSIGDVYLDWPYTYAFLAEAGQWRPNGWIFLWPFIIGTQNSWDNTTLDNFSWVIVANRFGFQFLSVGYPQGFLTSSDFTTIYEKWIDNLNAYHAKFSSGAWDTYIASQGDTCPANALGPLLGGGGICADGMYVLPILVYYGVTSSKIDTLQAFYEAHYASHNFAADRASACVLEGTTAPGMPRCDNTR